MHNLSTLDIIHHILNVSPLVLVPRILLPLRDLRKLADHVKVDLLGASAVEVYKAHLLVQLAHHHPRVARG